MNETAAVTSTVEHLLAARQDLLTAYLDNDSEEVMQVREDRVQELKTQVDALRVLAGGGK